MIRVAGWRYLTGKLAHDTLSNGTREQTYDIECYTITQQSKVMLPMFDSGSVRGKFDEPEP